MSASASPAPVQAEETVDKAGEPTATTSTNAASDQPPSVDQYVTASLWSDFVKDMVASAQPELQNLLSLEYEASGTRQQLEALHRQRLEHHQGLQEKRDQIANGIQQYLQQFQNPPGLSLPRR